MFRLLSRVLLFLTCILTFVACHKSGEDVSDPNQKRLWFEPVPDGMVYIHNGSFEMGSESDDLGEKGANRTVTVGSFWMDETEITNNQYRQFTNWVRDSIARSILAAKFPEFLKEDKAGDSRDIQPSDINWQQPVNWKNNEYREALEEMYLPAKERFHGKREIDSRKLAYVFCHLNLKEAARRSNSYNYDTKSYSGKIIRDGKEIPITDRSVFMTKEVIPVYPDTLCWVRDFAYSYNDPITKSYFCHPAFKDYPVVGVTWKQAKAFCDWRTNLKSRYLNMKRVKRGKLARFFRMGMKDIMETPFHDYRLPTEAEWEYAARGGLQSNLYPWGGYYTRMQQGCFLANFKPLRGRYSVDNRYSCITTRVGEYDPNNYGLYDMAGNVAEWTNTAYDESSYGYMSDFNPEIEYNAKSSDAPVLKRKVIRGGSWKDVEKFIRVSTRSYEYQDSAKSYIGFRCVMSSMGTFRRH
ncbi:MAG: SUMF1/EgtB/PvdO family nonheme iron enzyme [Bacteroidota bacterium]|nr:SUMF1/EgtB/PvdO family nonheme iron enzyme [Bacteroidota bacterium]MDP4206385.1 SUMF1/EgtB/PvdO family nonheme iron enzyme [Bacteroidota bacterium]